MSKRPRSEADDDFVDDGADLDVPPKRTRITRSTTNSRKRQDVDTTAVIERTPDMRGSNTSIFDKPTPKQNTSTPEPGDKGKCQVVRNKPGPKPNPGSNRQLTLAKREANKRADEAEANYAKARLERQEVEKELQIQKDRLRALQEKHLAGKNQGRDYLQDDDTIRTNLMALMSIIGDWAAEWSRSGLLVRYLEQKNIDIFLSQLYGSSKQTPYAQLKKDPDSDLLWTPLGCRIAAEAFLCTQIVNLVLKKPFHFLCKGSAGHLLPSEQCFEAIYGSMKEDIPETRLWASRTLRSLYYPHQYKDSITEPINDDPFWRHRTHIYNGLSGELLDNASSVLHPVLKVCSVDQIKDRREDLGKLLRAAGKLSLQLWVQDTKVISEYPCLVQISHNMNTPSRQHEAHRLSRPALQGIDQEELSVDLWVRPAIHLIRHHEEVLRSVSLLASKACYIHLDHEKCRQNREELERPAQAVAARDISKTTVSESTNEQLRTESSDTWHIINQQRDADISTSGTAKGGEEDIQERHSSEKECHVDRNSTESTIALSIESDTHRTFSEGEFPEQISISDDEELQKHAGQQRCDTSIDVERMPKPFPHNPDIKPAAASNLEESAPDSSASTHREATLATESRCRLQPNLHPPLSTRDPIVTRDQGKSVVEKEEEKWPTTDENEHEEDSECIITKENPCSARSHKDNTLGSGDGTQQKQSERRPSSSLPQQQAEVNQLSPPKHSSRQSQAGGHVPEDHRPADILALYSTLGREPIIHGRHNQARPQQGPTEGI